MGYTTDSIRAISVDTAVLLYNVSQEDADKMDKNGDRTITSTEFCKDTTLQNKYGSLKSFFNQDNSNTKEITLSQAASSNADNMKAIFSKGTSDYVQTTGTVMESVYA